VSSAWRVRSGRPLREDRQVTVRPGAARGELLALVAEPAPGDRGASRKPPNCGVSGCAGRGALSNRAVVPRHDRLPALRGGRSVPAGQRRDHAGVPAAPVRGAGDDCASPIPPTVLGCRRSSATCVAVALDRVEGPALPLHDPAVAAVLGADEPDGGACALLELRGAVAVGASTARTGGCQPHRHRRPWPHPTNSRLRLRSSPLRSDENILILGSSHTHPA